MSIIAVQFLNISATYGQTNQHDTTILMKVFRKVTRERQIVYVDTVNSYVPDDLKEKIKNGKVNDVRKFGRTNSITLTKAEQKYLISQIEQRTVWEDNLFFESKRIDSDSMWVYLRQESTKKIAAMNKAAMEHDTLALKKAQSNYSYVFTFKKPVYIRDNTICLIAFAAMCGSDCGSTEISFYKKENNEWVKWIVISSGDF